MKRRTLIFARLSDLGPDINSERMEGGALSPGIPHCLTPRQIHSLLNSMIGDQARQRKRPLSDDFISDESFSSGL